MKITEVFLGTVQWMFSHGPLASRADFGETGRVKDHDQLVKIQEPLQDDASRLKIPTTVRRPSWTPS